MDSIAKFDAIRNGDNQAFPLPVPDGDPREDGLSKRELLAGMAMQGLLACHGAGVDDVAMKRHAERSVMCADHLLLTLAQPQEKSDA